MQKVRENRKRSMLPGNPYSFELAFCMMHLPVFIAPKLINKIRAETETIPALQSQKIGLAGPSLNFLETCEWLVFPFNGIQPFYLSYPNAICVSFRWVLASASLLGTRDASPQSRAIFPQTACFLRDDRTEWQRHPKNWGAKFTKNKND